MSHNPEFDVEQDDPTVDTTPMFLTFRIGELHYGIDIGYVTEIVGLHHISPIPDTDPHVKGVINLRGKIIPVLDVRLRLGLEERDYDNRTCTIVLDVEGAEVGLIVDIVREVIQIPAESIAPPPDLSRDDTQRYIAGLARVDDDVNVLIDAPRLVLQHRLEAA